MPTIADVRDAARRIASYVHRTPVQTSATLDRQFGAQVFFKCENFQKVGAFKARGATNAVLCLDDAAARRGVITHSSGNHAAALAFAASIRGIPCTVVMPEDAPAIKVQAVRGYGAEIVFCARAERESTCNRIQAERGSTFVHPYENPTVIPGQGTAALELWEEAGPLDLVVAPVGGGGLLAGTAIVCRDASADAEIWGAEPDAVDDAYRSLESGALQGAVPHPQTVADGLMTGLGRINFEILRANGVRVETVSEASIIDAARFVIERMKLVVEPSAATVLAALRKRGPALRGRRIGAILSGGNTDLSWY
jgi:threonine dehydratase